MAADTIFAPSSGRPPAGVAVVRLSGPGALDAVVALAGALPPPRRATLRALRDPTDGALLDRGLVLAFPGPASATGEDMAELHLHGGPAVVAGVLGTLGRLPGLRLAEPGEFARRAFEAGKLDLAAAEGLADLVAAETRAQRDLALAGGRIGRQAEAWAAELTAIRARLEAAIDFADEADVAVAVPDAAPLATLRGEIATALADAGRGTRLRDGLRIAVVGPPNAGKSSIVNALARREVAIVTAVPGTTRDVIEVALDLGGIAATLIDTAGLRETADVVEAEGVRRARAQAGAADIVLHIDTDAPDEPLGYVVINKIDLSGVEAGQRDGMLHVSATTGAGLAALEDALTARAAAMLRPGDPPLATQARHVAALVEAGSSLADASEETDPVLRAEALRLAARALGRISGRVGAEDVLDAVFARFCIGK